MANSFLFTSESVSEGHPDKVADQISDAVLDAVLRDDPTGRVACECLVNTGLVVVSGEITLLIRFFINDSWVFGNRMPTWRRLWQFHVAAAGGFCIWFAVTVGLERFGIHYMLTNVIGSAASMCFSIATNFLWVWRTRGAERASQATAVSK
jgi:hypothetical protein